MGLAQRNFNYHANALICDISGGVSFGLFGHPTVVGLFFVCFLVCCFVVVVVVVVVVGGGFKPHSIDLCVSS